MDYNPYVTANFQQGLIGGMQAMGQNFANAYTTAQDLQLRRQQLAQENAYRQQQMALENRRFVSDAQYRRDALEAENTRAANALGGENERAANALNAENTRFYTGLASQGLGYAPGSPEQPAQEAQDAYEYPTVPAHQVVGRQKGYPLPAPPPATPADSTTLNMPEVPGTPGRLNDNLAYLGVIRYEGGKAAVPAHTTQIPASPDAADRVSPSLDQIARARQAAATVVNLPQVGPGGAHTVVPARPHKAAVPESYARWLTPDMQPVAKNAYQTKQREIDSGVQRTQAETANIVAEMQTRLQALTDAQAMAPYVAPRLQKEIDHLRAQIALANAQALETTRGKATTSMQSFTPVGGQITRTVIGPNTGDLGTLLNEK